MKQSDFFERLNKELDLATPPMSEELKSEPIPLATHEEKEQAFSFRDAKKKRLRFWGIATSAASLVIAFALLLSNALGAFTVAPQYITMRLDINPSLTVVLDRNYNVKKVVSANADADTLLSDETFCSSLVGEHAENAAVSIAERAAQTGYFDLEETGTAQHFNEITVSVLSDEAMPKEIASGIENKLTSFFCERGIYVYAHVEERKSEEAQAEVAAAEERDVLWYEFVAASENLDLTALWTLAKRTVFDYAEDLLADALEKYDLFGQIDALNDQIAADPQGKGKTYWTIGGDENQNISELCSDIKALLERLFLLYGTDCREKDALSYLKYLAASSYRATISQGSISSLRKLNETGIDDETFCGIENLTLRLRYYQLISNDFFQEIATSILEGVAEGAELILRDIAELTECRMQDRYEKYSVLFSLERSSISESAYAEFLIRIGKN